MMCCAADMPNQNKHDTDKYDCVEGHDEEDRSNEGTPKGFNVRKKATIEKKY